MFHFCSSSPEEKNIDVRETSFGCLLYTLGPGIIPSQTGDQACNPGLRPDQESNQQPFGHGMTLQPISHTSQG